MSFARTRQEMEMSMCERIDSPVRGWWGFGSRPTGHPSPKPRRDPRFASRRRTPGEGGSRAWKELTPWARTINKENISDPVDPLDSNTISRCASVAIADARHPTTDEECMTSNPGQRTFNRRHSCMQGHKPGSFNVATLAHERILHSPNGPDHGPNGLERGPNGLGGRCRRIVNRTALPSPSPRW